MMINSMQDGQMEIDLEVSHLNEFGCGKHVCQVRFLKIKIQ